MIATNRCPAIAAVLTSLHADGTPKAFGVDCHRCSTTVGAVGPRSLSVLGSLSVLMVMTLLATPLPLSAQHPTSDKHARPSDETLEEGDQRLKGASPNKDSVHHRSDAASDGSGRLRFESGDGNVKGRIGGRIMFDYTAGGIDDNVEPETGSMEDGTEFRRAWLSTDGTLYGIGYKFQVDFAGAPDIRSMYLKFPSPVPNSDIKVGKFREDIGLAERTSSKYITFMARPVLTEFAGSRDLGIRLGGGAADGALTYGVGVYRSKVDDALGTSQGDGDYKGTGRVTYVPWSQNEKRTLVHVGASGSVASLDSGLPPADQPEEAHEPEVHLAPDFVDTGPIDAGSTTRLGLELALVYNSFSVQTEYLQKKYGLDTGGSDPTFDSWYISGSYFLTGEHRPYDGGEFGRVTPAENALTGATGGSGAWELAARYSAMDLNDSGVAGGEMRNITLGINWYLNPSVRIMANYVLANVEDAAGRAGTDGRGTFVSLRFQLDF